LEKGFMLNGKLNFAAVSASWAVARKTSPFTSMSLRLVARGTRVQTSTVPEGFGGNQPD
jgi:hypothetical protein